MSVSFIVPVWREEVHKTTCLPWIKKQVEWFGAELVEVRDSLSIFQALERGRRKAKYRHLFYVHDDVRLLRPWNLVPQIVQAFTTLQDTGLIGPVGKVERQRVPWWLNPGPYVGHYCRRGKKGEIVYQYADEKGQSACREVFGEPAEDASEPRWNRFAKAGLVDGFFLVEDRERVCQPWDLHTFGANWHAYDMDRCFQTHALGLQVRVPSWLFMHDNAGHAGYKGTSKRTITRKDRQQRIVNSAGDRVWLADLEIANAALNAKWGLPCAS